MSCETGSSSSLNGSSSVTFFTVAPQQSPKSNAAQKSGKARKIESHKPSQLCLWHGSVLQVVVGSSRMLAERRALAEAQRACYALRPDDALRRKIEHELRKILVRSLIHNYSTGAVCL